MPAESPNHPAPLSPNDPHRWWPFAAGGEGVITAATVFLLAAAILWLLWRHWISGFILAAAAGLWLAVLFFFRDPRRNIRPEPGFLLSPADGQVVQVAVEREDRYLQADAVRISIFLSLLDVHVQRIPLAGQVTLVERRPGQFLQAYKPEASRVNEAITTLIETEYGPILVRQVAGILARRCVNDLRPGDVVRLGQRFGLIRFGSRVDLFLPPSAQVLVTVGAKVKGGLTPLAAF